MDGGLLVGDVGGTNARFALAVQRGDWLRIERFEVLAGESFPAFSDALRHYLDQTGVRAEAACIAVAGPVRDGEVHLTNRDWRISEVDIRDTFGISKAMLINDFVAMARSVPELEPEAFELIVDGEPVSIAPMIVAGPGTGFGVSNFGAGHGRSLARACGRGRPYRLCAAH